MGTIARPAKPTGGVGGTSWVAGADLLANELNEDIDPIYADYNGNISDVNIAASAAITGTKIAAAPAGIPTDRINALAVTGAKIAAATISSDKFNTTEYTNPAGLGAIVAGGTVEHDTGVAAATRQALAVWFTGAIAGQILLSLRVSGGNWFVSVYCSDSAPVTVNAGEVHMLHIAKT